MNAFYGAVAVLIGCVAVVGLICFGAVIGVVMGHAVARKPAAGADSTGNTDVPGHETYVLGLNPKPKPLDLSAYADTKATRPS